jgi:hypothetical protein
MKLLSVHRVAIVSVLIGAGCNTPAPVVDAAVQSDAGVDAYVVPMDWPAMQPPVETTPLPGVVRELVSVETPAPPPNPVTSDATPAELNRIHFLRFRAEGVDSPRAIVLAMPGFLGGAGSFESLARELVSRSITAGDPIEVWAIDRRANLLEDLRGLDAAEVLGDSDVARGYYFGRDTVGGEAFPGFLGQDDVPYASEWGVATHFADLRTLVTTVAAASRRGHVFLMGHSLGGTMAETYAAWRFEDGVRGCEELAGIILVDGGVSDTPVDETLYREGGGMGFTASPGLDAIRAENRFFELPLLGLSVYARAEILAMDALTHPDDVIEDDGRARVLATLLGLTTPNVPAMTNEAAFGFGFDDASNGLTFVAVSVGHHAGGPVTEYASLLGPTLIHPSDPDATYTWVDAFEADPPELTPVASLAHAWVDGRTNFGEWYFPQRLPLDLTAVGGLALSETSWQATLGLRAFDGALMDAPVLAISAGLRPVAAYASSRARAAPIGPGRVLAEGTPRTDPAAFDVVDATFMTHIDPLSAPASDANIVPGRILAFVMANVEGGTVTPTLP